jgi:MSHA pilin protein MshD
MSSNPLRRQRGLTLLETVMFMVIVGIALAAILQVLNYTAGQSADPLRRKQALMIAEGLLEEVQLAKFTFCDPWSDNFEEAGSAAECILPERFGQENTGPLNGRPFDNINDYVSAPGVKTAAFGAGDALTDANGDPMNVEGYSAHVTISPASLGGIDAGGTGADVDVLRIRVEVSYGDEQVVLDGFRTRYAPKFQ